ncbi:transposase [Weizmannia sp. CD-2023]|uniref:transposase n=1 Tax=Weizmannia sp. CD-2023 TaxID=3037263 RepID=UPI002E22822A|nr:transposase [Weizmannia sp. CD-2023]
MKELPGKRGRKNKYFTHVQPRLEEIAYWCRDGLTEEEICKRLGISVASLNNYKNEYIELLEALKTNREIADYRVENSLYLRALGYEYEEETWEEFELDTPVLKEDGTIQRTELRLTKKVKKKQAPDVTAQIFWLKNRRPDKWRDKQDIEHSGSIKNEIDMSGLSLEELRRLAKDDHS